MPFLEMKGLLFFLGTFLRWPVQDPKAFLKLHVYLFGLYAITYFLRSLGLGISNLIFTSGILAPIAYSIYQGLPLDCLNYESAIQRENSQSTPA